MPADLRHFMQNEPNTPAWFWRNERFGEDTQFVHWTLANTLHLIRGKDGCLRPAPNGTPSPTQT